MEQLPVEFIGGYKECSKHKINIHEWILSQCFPRNPTLSIETFEVVVP